MSVSWFLDVKSPYIAMKNIRRILEGLPVDFAKLTILKARPEIYNFGNIDVQALKGTSYYFNCYFLVSDF